jgi:hypothetical protein
MATIARGQNTLGALRRKGRALCGGTNLEVSKFPVLAYPSARDKGARALDHLRSCSRSVASSPLSFLLCHIPYIATRPPQLAPCLVCTPCPSRLAVAASLQLRCTNFRPTSARAQRSAGCYLALQASAPHRPTSYHGPHLPSR